MGNRGAAYGCLESIDTNRDGRVGLAELSQALGGELGKQLMLAAEVMQVAMRITFLLALTNQVSMLDNMNNH